MTRRKKRKNKFRHTCNITERKQRKGKCANMWNRHKCWIHGENQYGLMRCPRPFCCGYHICPLCHVRCPTCRIVLTNHPVLGKLVPGKVGYWSESQLEDYEKGYANDEEDEENA